MKPLSYTVQPQFIYPEPRLSRLTSDQQIHQYACVEGMANDLLGVWQQLNDELDSSTDLSWPKLTDLCTYMNAADHDHAI